VDHDEQQHNQPTNNRQQQQQQRLLDRNGTFHQSRGRYGIQRLLSGTRSTRSGRTVQSMMQSLWEDWFHSLAHRPTIQLMTIIFFTYVVLVIIFAYIYLGVSMLGIYFTNKDDPNTDNNANNRNFCGMDITNHMEALYFSLSTMTTIGYGVSDYYFGDCWTPLLLVLWQACCAITFQSIAIGLLFQRISRGQKRGKSVVFSNQACIRRVQGVPYLLIRIGELRKHCLINVSVKCFCIKHERYYNCDDNGDTTTSSIETSHFVTRHLPLCYPQEEVNSHVFMSVPQVICHRMDEYSPLLPSGDGVWYDGQGNQHDITHTSDTDDEINTTLLYHKDRQVEILIQVEGTDELTGQIVQAKHSYVADDLVWGATFAPCIHPVEQDDNDDRRCRRRRPYTCHVDFSQFHNIVSVPDNVKECPYVVTPKNNDNNKK